MFDTKVYRVDRLYYYRPVARVRAVEEFQFQHDFARTKKEAVFVNVGDVRVQVSPELLAKIPKGKERAFVRVIQKDLNRYVWLQYPSGGGTVLAEIIYGEDGEAGCMAGAGLMKLLLAPSANPEFDYVLNGMCESDPMDAVEAAEKGKETRGVWWLLKPDEKPPADFLVVLNDHYDQTSDEEKDRINAAWGRVKLGRLLRSTRRDGVHLALLQPDPLAPYISSQADLEALGDELSSTGSGRATTDIYETRRLRQILDSME